MRNKILFATLLLAMIFGGCKKEVVYNVPAQIQPYIDDFISEAAARGVNLEIEDLIVIFENDLEVDGVEAAGICTRSNSTPEIKLDTTSVNWRINLSSREQLVFHELGHCVLERSHIDLRMPNGNFKTMMRPTGEQVYGPQYTNFKREYYLDELFDVATEFPDWATNVPSYNSPFTRALAYEETFSSENGGWSTGVSDSTSRKIENGLYKLKILAQGGYFVGNELNIETDRDFEMELLIKLIGTGFTGMLWGGEDTTIGIPSYKNIYFGSEVISMGSILNGTESSYESDLIVSGFNKITIRKVDNNLIYYFNEEVIDNMQIDESIGNEIGIAFGGGIDVEVQVDEIKLFYLN